MRSYEIALSVAGVQNGVSQLTRMANEMRKVADAQRLVNQQAALVPRTSEAAVKKLERIAEAYVKIAKSAASAQAAAAAYAVFGNGRVGGGGSSTGGSGGGTGFISGPNQRLAEVNRQLAEAMKDPAGNADAINDLGIAAIKAQKAITAFNNATERVKTTQEKTQVKFMSGPYSRLEKILSQYQIAALDPDKNATAMNDLVARQKLAQRQIFLDQRRGRDEGPGLLESFRTLNQIMASLSRGNIGAAFGAFRTAQKAHQTAASNGGGGGAGVPAGLPLKGFLIATAIIAVVAGIIMLIRKIVQTIISAFQTLVHAIQQAAVGLQEFRAAQTLSGGSAGEIAKLRSMGIPVSQIAGTAAAVVQAMSPGGDPMAIAAAMRLGLRDVQLGRPFGPTNEAGRLLEVMTKLTAVQDRGERLRLARMMGLESILPMLDVAPGILKARGADAGMSGKVGEMFGSAGQSAMASWQRVMDNFQTAVQAFGGAALPPIINGLNALADALRRLSAYFLANPASGRRIGMIVEAMLKFASVIVDVMGPIFNAITIGIKNFFVGLYEASRFAFDMFRGMLPMGAGLLIPPMPSADKLKDLLGLGKDSDFNTAVDANTKATKDLTVAVTAGMYGGGSRARGALPTSLRGVILGNALEGGTLRLGAFSL